MLEALELRKQGVDYRQIAERLGYAGPAGAFQAVETALRETLREPADALRQLEAERLDALTAVLWPLAVGGSLAAVDRLLKVMEQRARLLGLDRPVLSSVVDIDLKQLTDEQLQRLADGEDPTTVLATGRRDSALCWG
ncbi:MAG: hypothetical protein ACOY3Y_20890 [Acidobacteriota bacterium]